MKKFEDILGYNQSQLKNYLCNYLCGTGYKIFTDSGYIFAKGNIPVLLVAHMDTFGGQIPKTIIKEPTLDGIRIIAENSIVGGDDRCGVWMIMNIIKKVKCHVLFLEDEEMGCVGANKFALTEHIDYVKDNISFMIELDRRGKNDCVFYSNDNKEFVTYIEEKTGTKKAYGSMSDISKLMPKSCVAGVNLSCGYYKEHTKDEYVMVDEMNDMINRLIEYLSTETEFPKFKYVEKKYPLYGYSSYYGSNYYGNNYYGKTGKISNFSERALRSIKKLCLTVVLDDEFCEEGEDNRIDAIGANQAECWATLFLENEDLCASMITRFYFT